MPDERVGPPLPGCSETEIDGLVHLYTPALGGVLVLSESASRIWRLCDGTMDQASLVAAVAQGYGVDPADIADDVAATLASLADAGAIEQPSERMQPTEPSEPADSHDPSAARTTRTDSTS